MKEPVESNYKIKEPSRFAKGEKDPSGAIVERIYALHTDSENRLVYVIYLDEFGDVTDWLNPDDLINQEEEQKYHDRVCELEPSLSIAKSVLLAKSIKRKDVPRKLIAKAIELAYNNDSEKAKKALDEALSSINFQIQVSGKLDYFGGCSFIFFLQFVLLYLSGNGFILGAYKDLILIMTLGSLGALLSVSISSGKLRFEPDSPRIMNFIAGALRVIIGILSSLVVYVALESEFLMGFTKSSLKDSQSTVSSWITRFLASVSGFSETFVPDLINRISNNSSNVESINSSSQKPSPEECD